MPTLTEARLGGQCSTSMLPTPTIQRAQSVRPLHTGSRCSAQRCGGWFQMSSAFGTAHHIGTPSSPEGPACARRSISGVPSLEAAEERQEASCRLCSWRVC